MNHRQRFGRGEAGEPVVGAQPVAADRSPANPFLQQESEILHVPNRPRKVEEAGVPLRSLPQPFDDSIRAQPAMAGLNFAKKVELRRRRIHRVVEDGADLRHVADPVDVQPLGSLEDFRCLVLRPEQHSRHERIKPVSVLRLREEAWIPQTIDGVARPPCALSDESLAEYLPRRRVESAFGDEPQLALLLVLIDVKVKLRPVPVRRLEPR